MFHIETVIVVRLLKKTRLRRTLRIGEGNMSLTHRFSMLIILIALTGQTDVVVANETQLKKSNTAAYLGVRVDLLSEQLAAQLPEDVLVGQGIMVSGFADNSVANKQGLKIFDILLTYDRHALMHPQKFINLIKADKPGRQVNLKVARKGEIIAVSVTLSSQQYPLTEDQLNYQYNMQVKGYDGLKIKQFSSDDFQAAIRYLAPDGVVRSRMFSGRYAKIVHEVNVATDLTNFAKQGLLSALSKRKKDEDGWFGDMMPFSDGNFSPDSFKNFGL